MQSDNNKIDAALLGKIVFARFLELPLQSFDHLVARVEFSGGFSALAPWVTAVRVKPQVQRGTIGNPASPVLGEVCGEANGRLLFLYHRESYARGYLFDEAGLQHSRSGQNFSKEQAWTLHRLRLINSRNQLTHALMDAVLTCQADYLRTGQALSLLPLPQVQMSARLKSEPGLSELADNSRISRLVRGLSIKLPNGKVVPLAGLFPKPRQVHCHFVDYVVKKEKAWIAEGILREPLTDEAVAEILGREYGIRLLRRTVANIRHDLAIPDCRSRSQRANYLAATEGFSALVPLTPQALRNVVPSLPGVYEIRATFSPGLDGEKENQPENGVPPGAHSVVYIGSAGDLRKRLGDHLRGSSDNVLLYNHLSDGAARVRFRLVSEGWRWAERDLYRVFCETFGTPPLCNRMSP